MNDLETAKALLTQKQLTLAIVRNGSVLFQTEFHRISGFLNAIEQLGTSLKGASITKVVGKAVALLCVYSGIEAVYAETLSSTGKEILEQNNVQLEWKELVDNILNDQKQDLCPFEKEAAHITNPEEAFERFKALQQKLRTCQ